MEMLVVEGGRKLSGSVEISGSKNAALPILIASLLCEEESIINGVPKLADINFVHSLLKSFGAQITIENENNNRIKCSKIENSLAHYDIVRKMRASVLVLAPLLVRNRVATVSLPGGCAIGSRPVDIHLKGLAAFGASIDVKDGYIHARLEKGCFVGTDFELDMPSVGASEQLIMAAVRARGKSILRKVAREPEVVELCEALISAGAKIKGLGTSTLQIEGIEALSFIRHSISPDRIEAGTFIAIAAATKSSFSLKNVCFEHMAPVIERFEHAGLKFRTEKEGLYEEIFVTAPERLQATDIESASYPGFPTDMQAQFMAAMTLALGKSIIYERIFENRMMHVPELRRMGAKIDCKNGLAHVEGVKSLRGAPVMATDLRASAALVIAALAAQGKSEIRRVYHLDRGYEALEKKLTRLGAQIFRCEQPQKGEDYDPLTNESGR
jgi:UDP-N-acetylglucosamine 1-carboxyvinyltransferase